MNPTTSGQKLYTLTQPIGGGPTLVMTAEVFADNPKDAIAKANKAVKEAEPETAKFLPNGDVIELAIEVRKLHAWTFQEDCKAQEANATAK
jgi:hypothetical protein